MTGGRGRRCKPGAMWQCGTGKGQGQTGCLGYLELPVDPELEVLIPDGVSAVLDCACLERVAGGRGQIQSHIAVRGCHCRKEGHVSYNDQEPFPGHQ